MWYNHLNRNEVRMLVDDAVQQAFKEGVVRALNERDDKGILGNKYLDYLSFRLLGTLPDNPFRDRQENGKSRAVTPLEVLHRYSTMYPGIEQEAGKYATQRFAAWWRKNVKTDHPAIEHAEFKNIDAEGKLYRADEDGNPVEYFSIELPEESLA